MRVVPVRFALKHALAAAVAGAAMITVVAVWYIVLVLRAILTDRPLDGPLAFPSIMLSASAAVIGAIAVILLTTAVTDWICGRRGTTVVMQIPVAIAVLAVVVFAIVFVAVPGGTSIATTLSWSVLLTAALLIPLGVYWTCLQSAEWTMRAGSFLWGRVVSRWKCGFRLQAELPSAQQRR